MRDGKLHNIETATLKNVSSESGICEISTEKIEISQNSKIDAYIWSDNLRPYSIRVK